MPELHFKGKEYVYNHHLNVPFRPLIAQPDKSIGENSGNLIIHGDNLHALKALLPHYAGKVDCIFIDPPYNTGNENWCYNDNVNSPIIREWIDSNPVNKEDMLKHDKWLCMMYPRLKLLHELLADTGSFWMTLDDNEIHRARMVLDEIFGEENFVATCIWQKKYSTKSDTRFFSESHEYLLVYAKDVDRIFFEGLTRTEAQDAAYKNPDNDSRGDWASDNLLRSEARGYAIYPVTSPNGEIYLPPPGTSWRYNKEKLDELLADNRIWFGVDGTARPRLKRFLSEVQQSVPAQTIWGYSEVNHSDGAKKYLAEVFGGKGAPFATPKPVELMKRVLQITTDKDSVILDSFAGSATTAHAVLAQNAKDGGNRKFILVECEDYADNLTAERVRRVINGYEFDGTQKEELHREKITWSNFSKDGPRHKLLQHVQSIENIDGLRFDNIKKEIKDGELIVTGEKKITEKVAGLGGGFTFYTLGEPLDIDKILTGETLPDYSALGAWLFHTATGQPLNVEQIDAERWYLGCSSQYHVWLIYQPDLDFLKSPQAALTLSAAESIGQSHKDKSHLVFAAAKYAPNRLLLPLGVEYAPLPFALYRIEKD
ncbi:site-specific DNA-methyltransferase [Methylomonas fluvii]|uniref:site-specific DNA-methyltransferase (adenine-specific) n=1 Tax=Methylomonas fluvii TaxID=1854564 RepID=A0ABR9DD46_9GAMM|nr:site-specific DNA-methyltransferase [Methylomonas fluvii]MBD9360771.1 site-specific DNA-methyltransferase [Methylomonas fluvii]